MECETRMQEGDALPTIEKTVTQEQIERYADAAGDHNPIHLDADFATGAEFGGARLEGTIAHGMMILAVVSEMMTAAFGEDWLRSGNLKVRFRGPVYPGETVAAFGSVKRVSSVGGANELTCAVGVRKDNGDISINGEAVVRLPANG